MVECCACEGCVWGMLMSVNRPVNSGGPALWSGGHELPESRINKGKDDVLRSNADRAGICHRKVSNTRTRTHIHTS